MNNSYHWQLVKLMEEAHGKDYTLGYLSSIFEYNIKWNDDLQEKLEELKERSIQIEKERNR